MIDTLEPLLLRVLRHAPFEPQRLLLERLLHEAYPQALADDAFAPLRGRWLRIDVLDGPGWNVTLVDNTLRVLPDPVRWDARVAASLADYLALANQQADPDTLFFARRLVIEGDTVLGLVVKNIIFGNELEGVPAHLARGLAWLRAQVVAFPAMPSLPPLPLPGFAAARPDRRDAAGGTRRVLNGTLRARAQR